VKELSSNLKVNNKVLYAYGVNHMFLQDCEFTKRFVVYFHVKILDYNFPKLKDIDLWLLKTYYFYSPSPLDSLTADISSTTALARIWIWSQI